MSAGEPDLRLVRTSDREPFQTLDGSSVRELVQTGDAVLIPPGTPHKLWNPGPAPIVLLCCCSPPYRDDDTVLTE